MSGAEGKSDISRTAGLFDVRSMLFLPASNARAIARARASAADLAVLDLEDAVKAEAKDAARSAAVEAADAEWPMPIAIRINGEESEWHAQDLAAVASSRADVVIVPRVRSASVIRVVTEAFQRPVLAMVETAAGVLACAEFAPLTAGLIAGTNDLRADLRLPLDGTRDPISASLQIIVLAARAASVAVFDGVFNDLADEPGFLAECRHGRALGFDGKSLIHPDQIAPCNAAFGPSDAEIEQARRLIEAFSGGAQRFEDRMIERMHVEAAKRVLARSHR